MTTRRRLLLLALPTVAVLVAGVWLLWPRSSTITRANAAKIQKGMTLAEVEAILGGPERDESTGRLEQDGSDDEAFNRLMDSVTEKLTGKAKNWASDRVSIDVYLDAAGRVQVCYRLQVRRMQESPLAILRRWLRL